MTFNPGTIRCGRLVLLAVACLVLAVACAPVPQTGAPSTRHSAAEQPAPQQAAVPVEREADGSVLFRRTYTPPYVAETVSLPPRGPQGSINYEKRGVSPLRYKLRFNHDILLRHGTLELNLERLPAPAVTPGAGETDALFTLTDGQGAVVMSVYSVWGIPAGVDEQFKHGLLVEFSKVMPTSVWGYWMPLPREIEVGEAYQLAFSWGEQGNRAFFNGELLSGYTDYKERDPVDRNADSFLPYLHQVRLLLLGNDTYNGDNSPLDANQLHDITIYAEQR